MDKSNVAVIITIVIFFVLNIIGITYFNKCSNNKNTKSDTIQIVDTSYNKIVLDSIEINIKHQDSTIRRIKYRIQYEIKKANSIDDSAAVELFKRLCAD